MSISDGGVPMTMPIQPANGGGGFGGWGGEGSWFIILFLIFAMFGWGGYGGWGNNGNAGSGVVDGYVLTSDFANIERKLDGVNNGLSDGFYAMNTGMLNGFANVTQAVNQGFSQAEIARCNAQMAFMQQFFAIQQQISNCCCENREAIAQVRYDMATQNCATGNLIQNTTRDIIDAMNCGFRGIEARMTAQELAAKDAQIRAQDQRLFMAELRASQEMQTNGLRGYIDGQFAYYNPRPVPSFQVPPPYQYGSCGC